MKYGLGNTNKYGLEKDEKGNVERLKDIEMSESCVCESEPQSKNSQVSERAPCLFPDLRALPSVAMATLSLSQADHMHTYS